MAELSGGAEGSAPTEAAARSTRARWAEVSAIFDAALDLPPEQLAVLLEARCGHDPGLRAEVEALLRSAESSAGFLDVPAGDLAAPWLAGPGDAAEKPPHTRPGERFGPFRVVRELGHGGMGAVYLAERTDPALRQRVAVKLVREGLGSAPVLRRFLEERQILASLDHPDIARLVDGGITPAGVPWFAMEYVEGEPLDRFCDRRRLPVAERLALFCRVCDAVHFAHRKLVVHCDLKPSNILVTADGQPKLLDFGIARLVGAGTAAESHPTFLGARLLTPDFASPEQLRGEPVSTASDVYALGVLLYRLLSGSHPFRRQAAPPYALPHKVLDGELAPPSVVVARDGERESAEAGERPSPSTARLQRRLRGDLDAIVLKALRAEPEQRYPSAEQLAADLRRHLEGWPVTARARTRGYRARKFVRRNRASVVLAAAATALLLGFSVLTALQAERIATERDRAQRVESFLVGLLHSADPYAGSGRAMTVRELLDNGVAQLGAEALEPPEVRARLYFALGKAYHGLGEYDRAIELLDSTYALRRQLHGERHPDAIGVANQLADALRVAGRYDAARELYAVILAARRERYGDDSPRVARSLNGLAMVLRMQGRYDEAEALLREALALDRRHRASEPAGLPQSLNNLGHVMRERGELEAAEALHRESLAVRRALWGAEHFEVSVSLSNLAGVLRDRGDHAAADSVYREALALRQRLVGDQHPDLATDRAGYAALLHLRGDHAAAESLYHRALAVHRRALPEGHLVTATTLVGLGQVLTARGEARAAEPLLREALAIRERVLPPGHRLTTEVRIALDAALSRLGRPAEAKTPLRQSRHTPERAP